MANLLNWKDEDWLEAEAKLDAARRIPSGAERFEALKEAGILRSRACTKLLERDDAMRPRRQQNFQSDAP